MTNQNSSTGVCLKSFASGCVLAASAFGTLLGGNAANAQSLNLAQSPLLTLKTAPGLVMLNMGRDLALYKAAYNDVNDLDGDGIPDIFFKPGYKYEGYFANDRCYSHDGAKFTPTIIGTTVVVSTTDSSKNYFKCPLDAGTAAVLNRKGQIIRAAIPPAPYLWSGNFLNWTSMARIDVLRKVLYGGKRSTDTAGSSGATILERTYVPQDSTLWGKEYTSAANDGYDIRDYAPLQLPTAGTRHMFANVTLAGGSVRYALAVNNPLLIVYENRPGRIWDLTATERPILGNNPGIDPAASTANGTVIKQYIVRIETCKLIGLKYEDGCTAYKSTSPIVTTYKPTGLLQKYGETKSLAFGLISGTWDNNYAGGVLRKNVDDFNNEVDSATGQFIGTANGVVYHLDAFRPWGFAAFDWNFVDYVNLTGIGQAPSWGNPLGEMMYEGLKYFAAAGKTPEFSDKVGVSSDSPENAAKLNLNSPAWINPYAASASRTSTRAYPSCAKPVQMTIGDPKTSFDSDQLPGSSFATEARFGSALTTGLQTLDVSTEADAIWFSEFGGQTKRFFIGEAPGDADQNPSAKSINSFKNIRGHGPDATTNQGSFYGASVARFGKFTGITNPALPGTSVLRVDQVSIALDSHIPQIKFILNGKTVSIVPLSKSVKGGAISNARGNVQQTGAIVGFFIDKMANTNSSNIDLGLNNGLPYYKFRLSFSDIDTGGDNENDGKVTYEIKATSSSTFTIGLEFFDVSTFIEMHQGYVVAGTTTDGVYLDTAGAPNPNYGGPPLASNVGYFLDTLPAAAPEANLPGSAMLTPATGPGYTNIPGRLPMSTLAAPRTFRVGTGNTGEYIPHDMLWYAAKYGGAVRDTSGGFNFKYKTNGDPENYFLANNPSQLSTQLGQAFQKAASLSAATSSAVAGNGVRVGGSSFVYQASYDTVRWGGDLKGFAIDGDGNVSNTPTWQLSSAIPLPGLRNIVLGKGGTDSQVITPASFSTLDSTAQGGFKDDNTFRYLLGERTSEQSWTPSTGGRLRDRNSAVGDIVNSDPVYINTADFGYADTAYQSFKTATAPQLVGFGSNDGFFRLVSATSGVEKLAFIPLGVRSNMLKLADPAYEHRYYVDGPSSFGHVKWSGTWKSVVASSLGAGGKAVFAINATSSTPSPTDVLWEFGDSSAQGNGDLGNVVNKPIIGMLDDGTTPVVIVGNGVNSTNGRATLFILNASTGAVVQKCTPSDAANVTGNGLGSTAFVSSNNNGKISFVYGSDIKGNIWRFDPSVSGCATDRVFTATDAQAGFQPITGEVTVIKAPAAKAGYMVLFGTGSYLTPTDPANTQTQSLYGVWDDLGATAVTRSQLATQTISTTTALPGARSTSITTSPWYNTSTVPALKGWKLDLTCSDATICPPGERSVAKPTLLGSGAGQKVFFLSIVPGTDPCQVGGGGWLTSLDPTTGGFTKGFATIDQNSTYIPGVTPRGIFLVRRTATANNPTTDILLVSVTISNGVVPSPKGTISTGGVRLETDGSGTGVVGLDVSEPVPVVPGFGTRRQVWRQIQ